MTDNLLTNGSFGGGGERFPQETGISGLLPNGWTLKAYSTQTDPKLDKQDADWLRPEIIPIQWHAQFPEIELVYGATGVAPDGDTLLPVGKDRWALKVFKGYAPTMAVFSQTVEAPAGLYRFTCPIFPDQKLADGTRPSPDSSADWYLASEVRVGFSDGLTEVTTGWMDARSVRIGEYTAIMAVFNHFGGVLAASFGIRGRWGFANNGWFVDECKLERIDGAPVPVPSPDSLPVPPVVAPDSIALIGAEFRPARFFVRLALGLVIRARQWVEAKVNYETGENVSRASLLNAVCEALSALAG